MSFLHEWAADTLSYNKNMIDVILLFLIKILTLGKNNKK